MQRNYLLAVLCACVYALPHAASAAPITVRYAGFENGYVAGGLAGVRNVNAAAGQLDFNVVDDGGVYWDSTLNAFCIDVNHNLVTGSATQYSLLSASVSTYLGDEQRSLIGQLFDAYAPALGSATSDAAFQLSLWEIVYDFGSGGLDLLAGNFSAGTFAGARSLAQSWLATLSSGLSYVSSSYELFVLEPHNPTTNQTLLTWRSVSVPEPATLGILSAGLLLIGAAGRRKRS